MRVIPMVAAGLIACMVHGACLAGNRSCSNAGAPRNTDIQSVVEEPAGAYDGKTTSYTLSRLPLSNECVTAVENGLELKQGVDYQIEGRSLTLSAAKAPGRNDVLRVVFDAETNVISSAVPSQTLDSNSRSLLNQALIESAGRETSVRQVSLQQRKDEPLRNFERTTASTGAGKPSQPLPSFWALARRLSTMRTDGSWKSKSRHGDARAFEGMGDDAIASPYSYLFGLTSVSGSQDRSLDDAQAKHIQLPSFIMLQRLLSTDDPEASSRNKRR